MAKYIIWILKDVLTHFIYVACAFLSSFPAASSVCAEMLSQRYTYIKHYTVALKGHLAFKMILM